MSFVRQYQHIITNTSLSPRARLLWMLMASYCPPGTTKLWIKQATFAEELGCSKSSIGRALRELIKINLLADMNKRHLGRYKTYSLPGLIPIEPEKILPIAPLQKPDRGIIIQQRICTPIQDEQLNPRAKEFLNIWGKVWKEQFPKLDGCAGRPFLEACVEEATSEIRKLGIQRDVPGLVEIWLKNATEKFCL
ncbi:MAG: helix-turn-helix domain-containing protein [Myxococcaceae bacterium]